MRVLESGRIKITVPWSSCKLCVASPQLDYHLDYARSVILVWPDSQHAARHLGLMLNQRQRKDLTQFVTGQTAPCLVGGQFLTHRCFSINYQRCAPGYIEIDAFNMGHFQSLDSEEIAVDLCFLGFSFWPQDRLDMEIKRGDWEIMPLSDSVLKRPFSQRYDAAFRHLGYNRMRHTAMPGVV